MKLYQRKEDLPEAQILDSSDKEMIVCIGATMPGTGLVGRTNTGGGGTLASIAA
ncbi:hypothetical protein [Accumulibacter sp.]|uniref:Uncharacterized protein n=1 Tax=Candidatus Accumulibacter proximus TaxID=2954385 RepID=A0A935UGI3_9PROT|nr:hypothetical protein [Accumulibacter sp.]MBK7676101.1 hypothetical protein [Candidatus Accumulibacter proximus]MBL8374111.1 hypothetical protein [Accumulibacter sp.]